MRVQDKERLTAIKQRIAKTAYASRAGHIPSSLSCTEILYALYAKVADLQDADGRRDRIILSKEHARLAQMCVLVELGLVKESILDGFMADENAAAGHDLYNLVRPELSAVDFGSGALGHGIPFGVGCAIGDPDHRMWVLVGDGELQEGTCWEGIMIAGQRKLTNLVLIIDRNRQEIDDYTRNIVNTSDNLMTQISAFGFDCVECDGHDVEALTKTLSGGGGGQRPRCVICNTVKGREYGFALEEQGFGRFHAAPPSKDDYERLSERIAK